MTQEAGHKSLRDYVALLRRRGLVIAVVVFAAALVGLGMSLLKEQTFQAEASIRVQDPSESSPLGGIQPSQGALPEQTSAQSAETATRNVVLDKVKQRLRLRTSIDRLREQLKVTQDPKSNLIIVAAESDSAQGASRLANVVAQEGSTEANGEIRSRYRQQAETLRRRANRIKVTPTTPVVASSRIRKQRLVSNAASLEGLAEVTVVSQVAKQATPPSSAASPNPLVDTVVAAILGLILALILVAILEALDQRLRGPEEARELLGMPLVGVVPEHVLGGLPVGHTPGVEHAASMEIFRMLRTNIAYLNVDEAPRVVLVTSPVPEEGKSTVAMGVALASAASGRKTLLVEADLRRPVHSKRLGIDKEPGLVDYLAREAAPGDVLQQFNFQDPGISHAANGSEATQTDKAVLACVSAGRAGAWSGELLGSERFATFLREVRKVYDLVIVDSAPLLAAAETLEIAAEVDAVLFCTRLGRTTVEQAKVGKQSLERLPRRPVGLVATGLTSAGSADGYAYYSYAYEYRQGPEPVSTG